MVYAVPPTPVVADTTANPLPQVPVAGPGNAYAGTAFSYSAGLTAATDVGTDGVTPPAPVTWSLNLASSTCDGGFGMVAASIAPSTVRVSFTVPNGVTSTCKFTAVATRTDYVGAGNSGSRQFTITVVPQPASPTFASTPPVWASVFAAPAPPAGTLVSGVDSYPEYSPVVNGNPNPTLNVTGVPAWMTWTGSTLQMGAGQPDDPGWRVRNFYDHDHGDQWR